MCGILAILSDNNIDNAARGELIELIDRRGPDYKSDLLRHSTRGGPTLLVKAAVLHLRGTEMQRQPVVDEFGNILMLNGNIYNYAQEPLESEHSDTLFLAKALISCKSKDEVVRVFANIDGPFAFIYWSDRLNTLFYGRDLLGQKSLCHLLGNDTCPLAISSVALQRSDSSSTWAEVEPSIQCLEFETNTLVERTIYLWALGSLYPEASQTSSRASQIEYKHIEPVTLSPLNDDHRPSNDFNKIDMETALDGLEDKFVHAISKRIRYNRDTCLTCRNRDSSQSCRHSKVAVAFSGGIDSTMIALALDKVYSETETIDLVTVAFMADSPDRSSVESAFKELRVLRPRRNWRLVLCDVDQPTLQKERCASIRHLIAPCNKVIDDSLGCACWFISRAQGRAIDSRMDDLTFDLVSKDFIRYQATQPSTSSSFGGLLDNYTSPATTFFLGMGVDEQLGGYRSHLVAWTKSGAAGVIKEISHQMMRLPSRNLGRDDRTCSHHGRDVKLPYLDHDFVSFVNHLPLGLKMNLDESREIGPKKLLRELAIRWGLHESSRRVKRALQFGSRIALLERSEEKGNELCLRLT